MKKILVSSFLLFLGLVSVAQQDAIYSQYMFNPFMVNPAYAGSRESVSAVLLHRSQWLGLEGAPTTQTFSIHSPFKASRTAVGLNLINDQLGPMQNVGAFATYAYHLPFSVGKLSLAIRGGMYSSKLDRSQLEYRDPGDKWDTQGISSATVPTFDFGAYYYTNKFYAGLSITHLTQQEIGFTDVPEDASFYLQRHFMAGAGGAIELSESVVFKPSTLIKYVDGAPLNVDVNASFLFKEVFWLGASYRTNNGIVFISEYNLTDFLRIGYSYDVVLNKLRQYNSGTHEIFIGVDFSLEKNKSISPRYL